MIKLSICIPTYNFGQFIGQTIDSICSQIVPNVEVIILDGGSTDDTSCVVENKKKSYPFLKYYKQEFRGGIDKDIEKLVNFAGGDYCWLFSADDIMLPNSIQSVLSEISSGYDIYLCTHDLCTNEMDFIKEYPVFFNIKGKKVFHFSNDSERKNYFKLAMTSEAFFTFLAGPIFKKKIWDDHGVPESFYGTHWIIAGHLLPTLSHDIVIKYTNKKLLHRRGGNDSFSDGDYIDVYRIFIDSFQHVGNSIFGEGSYEMFHILRVLRNDVKFRGLLLAKLAIHNKLSKYAMNDLDNLAISLYKPNKSLNGFLMFFLYKIFSPLSIKILYFLYVHFLKGNKKI